jgi:hypothetical protein
MLDSKLYDLLRQINFLEFQLQEKKDIIRRLRKKCYYKRTLKQPEQDDTMI